MNRFLQGLKGLKKIIIYTISMFLFTFTFFLYNIQAISALDIQQSDLIKKFFLKITQINFAIV